VRRNGEKIDMNPACKDCMAAADKVER
jgi:hypothetical protein